MSRHFHFCYLLIFGSFLFFYGCIEHKKIEDRKASQSTENDTLINFTIDLIKKLDNNIKWNRIEFDSTTSKNTIIHRPIYCLTDKYSEIESIIKDFDLFRFFSKSELSKSKCDSLDFKIIKRYNSVKNKVIEINSKTIENWYNESEKISKAKISPSFQWYFSIAKPTLSIDKKFIYVELFESNFNSESFWVYIFANKESVWKLLYKKETIIEIL